MNEFEFLVFVRDSSLSSSAKLVCFILLQYRNRKTGLCYPAQDTLANACSLCRNTVLAAVRELEAAGLVIVTKKRLSGSRFTCNFYSLPLLHSATTEHSKIEHSTIDQSIEQSNDRSTIAHELIELKELREIPPNIPSSDQVRSIWESYNDLRADLWGEPMRCLSPIDGEKRMIEGWISCGGNLSICKAYLKAEMGRMKKTGKLPPASVNLFNQSMRDMIIQTSKPDVSTEDNERGFRRQYFRNTGKWDNTWGAKPEVANG